MNFFKKALIYICFVIEGFCTVGFTLTVCEKILQKSFTASDLFLPVILVGFLIITVNELLRIKENRKYVIRMMIYMKVVVVILAYAYFCFTIGTWPLGIMIALLGSFAYLGAHVIRRSIHDHDEKPKIVYQGFTGFDYLWLFPDTADEYCEIHHTDREHLDLAVNIFCCTPISYLFLWLLEHDAFTHRMKLNEKETDLLLRGITDPSQFIFFRLSGRIFRNDIDPEHLSFLDVYFEMIDRGNRKDPCYAKDYDEILRKNSTYRYCIPYTRENYMRFTTVLDQRYNDYKNGLLK